MEKLVTGITSNTFNDTIVVHAGMFGIPFIILISDYAKSSMQFIGLFKGLHE
jgi:hypothetical protein